MNKNIHPDKSVDLPPTGDRNADPITNAPGAHPIETGVGAALGGLATGAAVGSVAGPIGTAAGAAIGTVVGGLAGKSMGELIDPTAEAEWLRESFPTRPYVEKDEAYESYHPAYTYGRDYEDEHPDRPFHEVEADLKAGWDKSKYAGAMTWDKARNAVKDVFDYRSAHRYAKEPREGAPGRPFDGEEETLKDQRLKSTYSGNLTRDDVKEVFRKDDEDVV